MCSYKKIRNANIRVSIIVPVYNHEQFLDERLASIYNQTYNNFNVILLDDASTDSSLSIINQWKKKYPKITRVISNKRNSGSAFKQWRKGIRYANGDLIWIAEGDDTCELNFLECLIPFFYDESVMLSYCDTKFMKNGLQTWSLQEYLSEIDPTKWNSSFVDTANDFVPKALAIKNAIPNVSACLIKNAKYAILKDTTWNNLRLVGDWIFYLHIIRGGKIAYSVDTKNYYRVIDSGLSKTIQKKDEYYKEHEYVLRTVENLYNVKEKILKKNYDIIKRHYISNLNNELSPLDLLFRLNNSPNVSYSYLKILICCFSFSIGGGERYPIELANYLYSRGISVTFFDASEGDYVQGVRNKLNRAIPIICLENNEDIFEVAKKFGITHIHTHHANLDRLIASFSGEKFFYHIATMHGMYESLPFCDSKKLLKEYFYKVDHWTCVSNKNLITPSRLNLPTKNITLIQNSILPDKTSPTITRSIFCIDKTDFVICLASRAMKTKGWLEAIKIVNLANKHSARRIHLLLVGDGDFKQKVNRYESETIHLLGFREDVQRLFELSNLGILPTTFRGESAPLTLIECIHAGRPFIASNVGEITRMLTSEDGAVAGAVFDLEKGKVPINQIAQFVCDIANDPHQYQQLILNVAKVKQKFSPQKCFGKHIQIYNFLCKKND